MSISLLTGARAADYDPAVPKKPQLNMTLRKAIGATGQRQYVIALLAGVDASLLSMYINGRRHPPPEHQRSIAKVLHQRIADLFQEDAG